MTDVREFNQKFAEQLLETIRRGQDATVDAVATWTKAVQDSVAALPVPPAVTEAFDKLPQPGQFVDEVHDFAQKALTAQKDFAHRVFEAANPQPANDAAPTAAPKAAPKAAAAK